jgi:glutamine---fructose-6-phosphate transaminase (isomerizing)
MEKDGTQVAHADSATKSGVQMRRGSKTLKEIYRQPDDWLHCLAALDKIDFDPWIGDRNPKEYNWLFVGCGTSFHLAQAAADTFRTLLSVSVHAAPASEVLFSPALYIPEEPAVFPVLISRSGHTSEVLQVAELLTKRGIEFLAVTCDANELGRLSARTIHLPVTEESIVMTSSFTSMLIALQYIAARFAGQTALIEGLHALPPALSALLATQGERIEQFAQTAVADAAFLAQGALYPIAREASLKVMESSSSYSQFFHTLEFRHGPMSIVSDEVLVAALLSEKGYAEESSVLVEMKQLGARTLAIANKMSPEVERSADLAIELDLAVPELAQLVVFLVWGQLLGVHLGLCKGLDPDSPRHLSRVVTLS